MTSCNPVHRRTCYRFGIVAGHPRLSTWWSWRPWMDQGRKIWKWKQKEQWVNSSFLGRWMENQTPRFSVQGEMNSSKGKSWALVFYPTALSGGSGSTPKLLTYRAIQKIVDSLPALRQFHHLKKITNWHMPVCLVSFSKSSEFCFWYSPVSTSNEGWNNEILPWQGRLWVH